MRVFVTGAGGRTGAPLCHKFLHLYEPHCSTNHLTILNLAGRLVVKKLQAKAEQFSVKGLVRQASSTSPGLNLLQHVFEFVNKNRFECSTGGLTSRRS